MRGWFVCYGSVGFLCGRIIYMNVLSICMEGNGWDGIEGMYRL